MLVSSLGEIQQIYGLLQEIDRLLAGINVKANKNTEDIRASLNEVRTYLSLLSSIVGLSQRLGGTPDQRRLARIFSQTITILIQLRNQYLLTMTTLGPVGWAMLGISAVGTAVTAGSLAADVLDTESEVY
jgi:hypothetical protein